MYLILLLSLVGIHVCFSKMASILMDIRRDFKKINKKKHNEFCLYDYVDATERVK